MVNVIKRLIAAVGYIRCSTEMQEDSPDQQKKEILVFAAKNDYEIIDWYEDFGKSGTTFGQRSAFQRLWQKVQNGRIFNTVICYDESRWGRAINPEENAFWRVQFRNHGVNVVLVKTSVDPENDYASVFQALEGAQAADYSKKLSELTLRGAMNNEKFSNGGTAPYGYRRLAVNMRTGDSRLLNQGDWCVRGQEKVTYTLGVQEEVETVRFIFEQRANGMACVLIAKALNENRVPCAQRGKWRNYDRKWSGGTIKSLVENPAYYGTHTYNRYSTSRIIARKKKRPIHSLAKAPAWRNPREEWLYVENAHEPIVSKELWEKANSINKHRPSSKPNQHSYHSNYLLSGLIQCSRCEFAFQGSSSTVRGKPHFKYIDGGWANKRVCSYLGIPKEQMEEFAIAAIKQTISDPGMIANIEERLAEMLRKNEGAADTGNLEQELKSVAAKIENLVRLAEEGRVGSEAITNRLLDLERQQKRIEQELSARIHPTIPTIPVSVTKEVSDFISNFEANFSLAPMGEKKALVKKCISKIVVDREENVARFFVRMVPAVTPQIEEILKNVSQRGDVASEPCARNRT